MFSHNVIRGKKAEELFEKLLLKSNIPFHRSTPYEDKYEHIDYYAHIGKSEKRIDVKALKKIRGQTQDDFFYIEIVNDWGNKGWIYAPKMDVVAFECFKEFQLYKREKLLKYIEGKGIDNFMTIQRTLPNMNTTSKCILLPRKDVEELRFAKIFKR